MLKAKVEIDIVYILTVIAVYLGCNELGRVLGSGGGRELTKQKMRSRGSPSAST